MFFFIKKHSTLVKHKNMLTKNLKGERKWHKKNLIS